TDEARSLLLSPLGGADPSDLRRLGRALRAEERAAGDPDRTSPQPRPSADLIREAVAEPATLVAVEPGVAAAAARVGAILGKARDVVEAGGSAEQALWALWSGTTWPARLRGAAERGGAAGQRADRDLDALCALFDAAARAEERLGRRGVLNFLAELEAQQIPGDTLAERATRGAAVRVLTAHRAKGLEWRLVVVAGVQEGVWPDLRRRGSLLQPDRIGRDGLAEPLSAAAMLAEERRLFYVAVTRSRQRLVVTAVRSAQDDGDQPSRFLAELGVPPVEVTERPLRPLSLASLVGELRAVLVDPQAGDRLRRVAAARLAVMAGERDPDGHLLVPAARPEQWWGLEDETDPGVPVRDPARPVALSGSALTGLQECPLRWFLAHEAHAESARTAALGFGSLVHTLADDVAHERIPADLAALMERLDRVWDQLAFDAPWQSHQQKGEARQALARFLAWHTRAHGRVVIATEQEFALPLHVGDHEVAIRGFMDRVERAEDGAVHIVDFKTGRYQPSGEQVATHPQLGVYQLAVRSGALGDAVGEGSPSGGAELVQLRLPAKDATLPLVQRQPPLPPEREGATWIERLLGEAARRILAEEFPPAKGQVCGRCEFRRCCPAWPEGRQVVE
ncbi:MAG: PD-(D/E)XK nuclease family protein, partial [Streptomycetales bacterium]